MHPTDAPDSPSLVSNRFMELVMALLLIVAAAIAIFDSLRLGIGWRDDGPAPGFFPFWLAVILAVSSIVNLARAIGDPGGGESFVSRSAFWRVLAVLVPTLIFVAFIGGVTLGPVTVPGLGIYVASFLFITLFMLGLGREGITRALLVGLGVPVAMFFMFEKWFLVPLPKGPLEAMLGLG